MNSMDKLIEDMRNKILEIQELHVMQLAAISTAALQNTEASKSERIGKYNPYWTVAYQDVCDAVDREILERNRANRINSIKNLVGFCMCTEPRKVIEQHICGSCNNIIRPSEVKAKE